MRATPPDIPRDFDVTHPDMWARRLPVEELAELRRAAPIASLPKGE
ncbi:hypothetical protein [Nocardia nova]|nr:hypothetical protein [Nocardia nova]